MKKIIVFASLLFTVSLLFAQSQKVVSDCTVTYSISGADAAADKSKNLQGATKTLYIKGKNVRSDINSSSYNQSIIINNTTGGIVILREIGTNKYMSVLDDAKWKEQNTKFVGMKITLDSDTKTILGYECKKATAHLANGSILGLYYAPVIIPSALENAYQFNGVPGFVLEYESISDDGKVITYTANKINLNPVPGIKFEIPTNGYRIL